MKNWFTDEDNADAFTISTPKPNEKEMEREFWELCGFKYIYKATNGGYYYYEYQGGSNKPLPPIDLNNLWKFAVPKALEILARLGFVPPIMKLFQLWYDQLVSISGDSNNTQYSALALFQVLYSVLKEKGK